MNNIHYRMKPIPFNVSQGQYKDIFEFIKYIDTALSCLKCNIFLKADFW